MKRPLTAFLALALAAIGVPPASAFTSMRVWAVSDTIKVLATSPPGPGGTVSLYGARGEYVSFQVMVRATASPLGGVMPRFGGLRGPNGRMLPLSGVHLYREAYQDVKRASDRAGHTGLWPDGLLPIGRDPIVGESRNGAPFAVAPGRAQGVWVDMYVPRGQMPGKYSGTLFIAAHNQPIARVPVHLTVWAFTLPVQPSLPTAFGYDTWDAYRGHYGSVWSTAKITKLTNLYTRAALQMRISLFGIDVADPDYAFNARFGRISRLDWTVFDSTAAPAYDGTLDPLHRRFTAGSLPFPDHVSDTTHKYDAEDIAYWQAVAAHYRSRGWLSRSYLYYDDEPSSATDYANALIHARLLHRADTYFRYLLTTHYRPDLVGQVNIWTPIINELDTPGNPGMAAYRARQRAGDEVWWYDSDSSADQGQWPDMFIDHPAMNQRVMGWMTWRYGLQGFLYYDTVYAYPRRNPWSGVYDFGTNGDGTLFYPGKPSIIGGKTDIPCFSIRLMETRQSLQDYEYMRLLSKSGHQGEVDALVRTVVTSSDRFAHDPGPLLRARLHMGRELSRLAQHSPSARVASTDSRQF